MKRKIVILISLIVIAALAGGFFYFWQSQKDVRVLNKTLPKGVFVTKSLWGNEYKVVNKIDGYEFKVPKALNGINEIEYTPERTEMGYTGTSLNVVGNRIISRLAIVNKFKISGPEIDLKTWAEKQFEIFGLTGTFTKDKTGDIELVKYRENAQAGGASSVIFFKRSSYVYSIAHASEESIKEIIINGKW